MKRKQLFCILLAGACMMSRNVCAEEPAQSSDNISAENMDIPYLEPRKEYNLDLDGDGITQRIRFESELVESEDNWHNTLSIYQNDELLYTLEGEKWTYMWKMQPFNGSEEKTYLLASSVGDNDWTHQSIVLAQKDESSLTNLGDLSEISRKDLENSDRFLSGWARIPSPRETEKPNTIRMSWMDTIYVSGLMHIVIDYEVTEKGIKALKPPYALEEADNAWHAIQDFPVVKEPGSEETIFQVKTGDEVKLTRITAVNGTYYLECANQQGQIGWIRNTDEVLYDAETGSHGYFKEANFVG